MYEKKLKAFPTTKYYNFSHFSAPGDKIIYFVLCRRAGVEFGTRGYLGEFLSCFPLPVSISFTSRNLVCMYAQYYVNRKLVPILRQSCIKPLFGREILTMCFHYGTQV